MKKSTQVIVVIVLSTLMILSSTICVKLIIQLVQLNKATDTAISTKQANENVEGESEKENSDDRREEYLLAVISEAKRNEKLIGAMQSELLESLKEGDKAHAYSLADKIIYHANQLLELRYEDFGEEAFVYISSFRGYADMAIKNAEAFKKSNGNINDVPLEYTTMMFEFSSKIIEIEEPILTALIERKGMIEQSKVIIDKIRNNEDSLQLQKEFQEKLLKEQDLTPFERILVENLLNI